MDEIHFQTSFQSFRAPAKLAEGGDRKLWSCDHANFECGADTYLSI